MGSLENESTVGVVQNMIFSLDNITRWNCAPNDAVHCLAEGVFPKELSICLHLISKSYKITSKKNQRMFHSFSFLLW